MICPTCRAEMIEKGSLSNWWCPNCGTAMNPYGDAVVPTQAIQHKRLQAALINARQFAMNAIAASVTLQNFDPANHALVKEIDAVLADRPREGGRT